MEPAISHKGPWRYLISPGFIHTDTEYKTMCCECECSFWLPLQLYCEDDVHLSSLTLHMSCACPDR